MKPSAKSRAASRTSLTTCSCRSSALSTCCSVATVLISGQRASSAARCNRLNGPRLRVQRLLSFARRQSLETRAVDLAMLMDGMRDLIASSVGPGIELRMGLPTVYRLRSPTPTRSELALTQSLLECARRDAERGVLTVAVERATLGPRSKPRLTPGLYLRLPVIDTGAGMDEATLARSVELFFSTKEQGKGTGLGLSMVHGFMGQLGGGRTLVQRAWRGYACRSLFSGPQRPRTSLSQLIESETVLIVGRPLSILLVDDENIVGAGTAEMLRDSGHTVTEAHGGCPSAGAAGGGPGSQCCRLRLQDAAFGRHCIWHTSLAKCVLRIADPDHHGGMPAIAASGLVCRASQSRSDKPPWQPL